jgi:isopenicillin N synthase-like dioxygenase
MNVKKVSWTSENFGQEIVDSFRETGFAVVTDHNIDQRVLNMVYEDWMKFFQQTDAEKRTKLYNPKTQSGWFPPKEEKAKDAVFPDMKEFYHFYKHMEAQSFTTDLANSLERMAISMLSLIEQELRNRQATITCQEPLSRTVVKSEMTLFRLLHYPPTRDFGLDAELMERAAAHEDINLITLLPVATAPGLQVKDLNGNWHDVDADPGSIVVNVGDMLTEATAGYLPSTTHRVVADHLARNNSRYSMPLLLHPRPEVRLSEKYTAGEYLKERLIQLGLIKPEVTDGQDS